MKFKIETIEQLKKLANINPKMILEASDESIVLNSSDPSRSIYFTFKTLKENFEIEKEKIQFLDFNSFYNSFKALTKKEKNTTVYPSLNISERDDIMFMDMSIDRSTLSIALAAQDLMDENTDGGVEDLKDFEDLVKIDWNLERATKFKNMLKVLTTSTPNEGFVRFTSDGSEVEISIVNEKQDNTYREVISYGENTLKTFSLTFQKNIFNIIPDGDYVITILNPGILEFDLISEDEKTKLTFQISKV